MVPVSVSFHAMCGRYDSVREWFDESGDRDANAVDVHGLTLLYRVLQCESPDLGSRSPADRRAIVHYLVAKGADITAPGMTPPVTVHSMGPSLLYAHCFCWNLEMVQLLLNLGFSVSSASAEHTLGGSNTLTPLAHAFCAREFPSTTHPQRNQRIGRDFNPAVLREMVRAGASLDFLVPPGNVPPDQFLRELLGRFDESRFELDESRTAAINEGIALISGVREAGSFKSYLRRPHKALLRLRALRARGRAHTTSATLLRVALLFNPTLPREIFWNVISYWRETE